MSPKIRVIPSGTLSETLNVADFLLFHHSTCRKYDHELSQILHADLHWLHVADRSSTSLVLQTTVHRCLLNRAPQYLVDCCVPVSDIANRQQLLSARCCLLTVLRYRRSTLGYRAFSVIGPTVWNLLPDQLRDSECTESTF